MNQETLDRWKETPKDVVILHTIVRGRTIASASPFVLKVETYMRMAGIKYEIDTVDTIGPKKRFPWISLNGEHIPDSQFIVEFLGRKFEKNFSKDIPQETKAIATLTRVVMEEHFFWGCMMKRFIFDGRHGLEEYIKFENPESQKEIIRQNYVARTQAFGFGFHSETEIDHLMTTDLRAISVLLGTKKFICGDQPCEDDCGIFGILAQVLWTIPNSCYHQLIKDELQNLEAYCYRMKDQFWPDWDQILEK